MNTELYRKETARGIEAALDSVKSDSIEQVVKAVQNSKRVFFTGAGRSFLMTQAIAMAFMQIGIESYVTGGVTTPAIQEGDLLVIASGSGETGSLKVMAQKAKKQGASLATITIFPQASIGSLADAVIAVPGSTPKSELADTAVSVQPMGNAFEQMLWLICDTVVIILMKRLGRTEEEMFALHANLE